MMKLSKLLSLALLFVIPATLYGQNTTKTGVKGGLNFANFKDTDANYSSYTGFAIGGFARFGIPGSPLSIQPELTYNRKGAEMDESEIRIDYLEVPVLFKLSLSPGNSFQPNLFAGPYAGLRLVAEQRGTGGLFGGISNIDDETESVDYGAAFGGGIDIDAGDSIFTFDVRYSAGLSDVFRAEEGRNSVVTVSMGISLPNRN